LEEIEIDAAPEAVWRALTDPDELTNWFPLAAKVTPGPGGEVWFSWKNEFEGRQRIEAWEEDRHLALVDVADDKRPFAGRADYHLEDRGGKTLLRLVHSGFPADAGWDGLVDATRRGWRFELRGLRHYLEHHRGRPRSHVWLRLGCSEDANVVWERLLGRQGLCTRGNLADARAGDAYDIESGAGDLFRGTVMIHHPPQDLALVVANMNRSLVRLRLDVAGDGSGRTEVNLSLSAYGIHHDDLHTFHARWQYQLRSIFPDAEELPAPGFAT
jgi:uncharacterized protein YndB with AHSA1/START domain